MFAAIPALSGPFLLFTAELVMIPLIGQGEPLPADCPYTGEWLHKDKLFLYQPSGEQLQRLELTAGFKRADGEWCLGFNAVILASELGAWNEEIFEHNRTRTLILEVVGPAPPQLGRTDVTIYTRLRRTCLR